MARFLYHLHYEKRFCILILFAMISALAFKTSKPLPITLESPKIFRQWRTCFLKTTAEVDDRALVSGIFLGEDSKIPQSVRDDFKNAGLYHLLAASGFNCWIVAAIFALLARFLVHIFWLRLSSKHALFLRARIGPLAALFGAWCFFFWSDHSPPIVRATLMVSFKHALELAGIRARFHRTLLVHYLIFLILSPRLWQNASFQMTFGCLFGMLFMQWLFDRLQIPKNVFTQYVSGSLGASFGCMPVTWLCFGEINFTSLLTNFFAVPITSFLIMPFGLFAMLICPLSAGACIYSVKVAVFAANLLTWLVHGFLQYGASLRYVD